jgi:SAM-dependent methyltransferase
MPRGAIKALGPAYLDAASATSFYDLGMGLGKFCLQSFLTYPNLTKVVGVELSPTRYEVAAKALRSLASLNPKLFELREAGDKVVQLWMGLRLLEFRCQDLYACHDAVGPEGADIVICELVLPSEVHDRFVGQVVSRIKPAGRLMMLMDMLKIWFHARPGAFSSATTCPQPSATFPFQLRTTLGQTTFETTWHPSKGATLQVWLKVDPSRALT